MNFDDLKDQLQDSWERFKNRIQEDPSFNSIKERYETLPSSAQKAIVWSLSALLLLILFYIPYGYFETARENEEKYNSYKSTIRELLKVGKADKSNAQSTKRGDLEGVKMRITGSLQNFNLTEEQITPVELGPKLENSLAKDPVQEETFAIRLKKLNLDQVLQIGSDLHRKFSDLKMTGLTVNADKEKAGYFDIEFRLSKYYLAESETKEDEKSKAKNKKKGFKPRRKGKSK